MTRLILAGYLDKFPQLRILLAHAGGVLPLISSRLASCVAHDPIVASRLKYDFTHYLGMLYYDAVAYGSEELGAVAEIVGRTATTSPEQMRIVGSRRILFGTDHPFFPPLNGSEKWKSVVDNLKAIERVTGWNREERDGVRGGNAQALFGLS